MWRKRIVQGLGVNPMRNSLRGGEVIFVARGSPSRSPTPGRGPKIRQPHLIAAGQGFDDDLLYLLQLQRLGDEAVEGIGQDFFGADIAR